MTQAYVQCRLRNKETQGRHVAWIEESLANKGNTVSFKDEDGFFEVYEVYPGTRKWETINERSQDYKHTRKASDI